MMVEVLVGISNVGSEMVEGERNTAEIGWCYSYLLSIRRHMRRVISTCWNAFGRAVLLEGYVTSQLMIG